MLVAATKSSNGSSWFRFNVPVLIFFCRCFMRFLRLLMGTCQTVRPPLLLLHILYIMWLSARSRHSPAEAQLLLVAPQNWGPSSDGGFGQHVVQDDHLEQRQWVDATWQQTHVTGLHGQNEPDALYGESSPGLCHDLPPPQTRCGASEPLHSRSAPGSGCPPSCGRSPSSFCSKPNNDNPKNHVWVKPWETNREVSSGQESDFSQNTRVPPQRERKEREIEALNFKPFFVPSFSNKSFVV